MIRVIALYPHSTGKRFDFDYYFNRHIPMVRKLGEGNGLHAIQASQVVSILGSDAQPEHVCVATLDFGSQDALDTFLANCAPQVLGDMPNYTDIQPLIQVSQLTD